MLKDLYTKENYVVTFWTRGISVLVCDINKDGYSELDGLYIIDNGLLKQCFSKQSLERAKSIGLNFYSDKETFDNYVSELKKLCGDFQNFFQKDIENKESIEKNVVEKFFEYCVGLCRLYDKMNFEYTDSLFILKESNPIIARNLELIEKFKDEIRAFMGKTFFEDDGFLKSLLSILERQFSFPSDVLENLTQKEILGLFEGNTVEELTVRNRQNAFVQANNTDIDFWDGIEAEGIAGNFREKVVEVKEIFGKVASVGHVKGKVKIIPVDYANYALMTEEMEKMNQGDILVAETTSPELLIACKKAAAIVTDIGGMMSHAAIVSRELKIPCIVGTSNATKILEDGDMVEVDTERGIVKIL